MPSTRAVVEVMIDHLEQHRQQMLALLPSKSTTEREDTTTALRELERSLHQTLKVARRAAQALERQR